MMLTNFFIELKLYILLIYPKKNPNLILLYILIAAHIPVYIYPFLNTTEKQLVHYDYLRVNSLGVIGALLKVLTNNMIYS